MMTPGRSDDGSSPGREQQLDALLGAYFDARQGSDPPDPATWIARHPEFASDLIEYFREQDRLDALASPLREAAVEAWPRATTVVDTPRDHLATSSPRLRSFGDYELLEEIARGGMGVVYRARQIRLNRTVALKVIRGGSHAHADDLRRFQNEAEAAAVLDHPGIVPVHEVGEHDGIPYLSMKLIEGESLAMRLTDYRDHPRAAAELLAQVALAVDHAHRRGVLHRDLKPSNILIDRQGTPYVTDFGLAKLAEGDGELTRSGAILGTPSYMAPEQAEGRPRAITTATDVYGLGAVLYALLAGRPPYLGDSALEILEKVRSRSPESFDLAAPGRRIDRDLETICRKCLESDPARRYASAGALADDLGRWLRGEPITARPSGLAERAWRWCRRNPAMAGLVGATASLLAALVVGLVSSSRLIAHERDEARANFEAAQAAVDEYLTRIGEDRRLREPGLEPLRRELLGSARRYYDAFLARHDRDPLLKAECARASMRVGRVVQLLGSGADARLAYQKAVDLQRERLQAGEAGDEAVEEPGLSLVALGAARVSAGEAREAMPLFEEAVARLSRVASPSHRLRDTLAQAHHEIGALLIHLGRRGDAQAAYRRAIAIREPLSVERPDDADLAMSLSLSLTHLAWTDVEESQELRERSERVLRGLASRYPRDSEILNVLGNSCTDRGNAHYNAGRLDDSEHAYREALGIHRKLADASPDVARYRANVGIDLMNLAGALRDRSALDEARPLMEEATALMERLADQAPKVSTYRSKWIGMLLERSALESDAGDTRAAARAAHAARDLAIQLTAADPSARHDGQLARCLETTARLALDAGDLDAAAADLDEARKRLGPADTLHDGIRADVWLALARLHRERGDARSAAEAAAEALAIGQRLAHAAQTQVGEHERLALIHRELADQARARGDAAGARESARTAFAILDAQARGCPGHLRLARLRDAARAALDPH